MLRLHIWLVPIDDVFERIASGANKVFELKPFVILCRHRGIFEANVKVILRLTESALRLLGRCWNGHGGLNSRRVRR